VKPLRQHWERAINAAGGTLLNAEPKTLSDDTIIIGTPSDHTANHRLRTLGYNVYRENWLYKLLICHERDNKLVVNK
jgi:hypothetical protein